jgi:2-methylaconitate cis-trans-isomerase PrpF
MRGGTSRGIFFIEEDLPSNALDRDQILLKVLGAGEPRGVNGIGSEDPLLNKIAIISKSSHPDYDVGYLFIQGDCGKQILDTSGNCGNIIAAVGQFAIESGVISRPATDSHANIKIFNLNTKKTVESVFPIRDGFPVYKGDELINGVCGPAAPVILNFFSPEGAVTSSLFPTGNNIDNINGTPCTIIDCATLVTIILARDLNLTGKESVEELNTHQELLKKITSIRKEVCAKLGLPPADKSVLPKVCIISSAVSRGNVCARFFIPFTCHVALPLTGAIALAAASINQKTIFSSLNNKLSAPHNNQKNNFFRIEHPSGMLEVNLSLKQKGNSVVIEKAGFVRTARKIMNGFAYY